MLRTKQLVAAAAGFLLLIGSARGDWNVGDPYKMVNLQLPNTNGWDVSPHDPQSQTFTALGDDWVCSETGPVSDIHIWYSWSNDVFHPFDVEVSIRADVPGGTNGFSQPGDSLWSKLYLAGQFSNRVYATGNQGWYEPSGGGWIPNNHTNVWQLNIENIQNPFTQQQGTTYWLVVEMTGANSDSIGWKTSLTQNGDAAVWWDTSNRANMMWRKLQDQSSQPMDLAFVITPEPSTFLLVAVGALALITLRGRVARH